MHMYKDMHMHKRLHMHEDIPTFSYKYMHCIKLLNITIKMFKSNSKNQRNAKDHVNYINLKLQRNCIGYKFGKQIVKLVNTGKFFVQFGIFGKLWSTLLDFGKLW